MDTFSVTLFLGSGDSLAVRIPVLLEAIYNHIESDITNINI